MPKWKKDAKEFTVSINHNDLRGYQSSIPKPIMEILGEPKTVTFVINGKNISVVSGKQNTKNEKSPTINTSRR